ncbi:response regulator [Thermoleptolyngbya sp. C42_A2020_037]|uniref:response regulator n=1 Tax=Thermoleptolyngbya sp. C42_A2020_037 TaxID=2747799 RepID=UPI001A0724F5|nr:response regulator [Thermoleptolyngbya sp. C42_A2020_037]MBF2085551.1 response regulator [Thermoleptolyngbya sp. C42_A2020_037]
MASHKILVIDDSRVIRNMVRDMLPKGNFEVLEAKDGVEGINLIHQEHPNLIMLDFLLPRMSGWEVFQEIQAKPELRAPLVLMSGRREEVTEKLPEPFEYFEFIEKPFEQKDLVEAIKSAMAKFKKWPQPVGAAATAPVSTASSSAEVAALNQKIDKMQAEIDTLKKQMAQLLTFIKQKLK